MNYDTLQGMTPVHLLKNTKCNPHSGSLKAVLLGYSGMTLPGNRREI